MKIRVSLLITFQISIIICSFLVIIFFENQSTYLGNAINISGKNRFLAELLYSRTNNYLLGYSDSPPFDVINNIDKNIDALSQGGTLSSQVLMDHDKGITVMSVPTTFSNDLEKTKNKWSSYKASIINEISSKNDHSIQNNPDVDKKRSDFISAMDNLTLDLSSYAKEQVSGMTTLEMTLLVINVTAHLLLLRIILKIIKQEHTRKILFEQVSQQNKQLLNTTIVSKLEKSTLELILYDMSNDILQLKHQVSVMKNPVEHDKNKLILDKLIQDLSTKIQKLAVAKNELEDTKSYYEQLNRKLAESLSVLSKKGNKITEVKNAEDLIVIIQSYVEAINLMIYTQKIPPPLGKNLTNAMNEIIDELAGLKNHKSNKE